MGFKFDDGGRAVAGYRGETGDCVTRAIAVITGKPYGEVYDALNGLIKSKRQTRRIRGASARTGVPKGIEKEYLAGLGYQWTPTMSIGSGCKVHLKAGELPMGRLIVRVSKHLTAVIDGVVHDIYNPCHDGTRCVYGYWSHKEDKRCHNPLWNSPVQPPQDGWRRTERLYCSGTCRQQASVIKRAAQLLEGRSDQEMVEVLRQR